MALGKEDRVAVLTSGGDAPGMNAAVRAAACVGAELGLDMVGVEDGYSGLLDGPFTPLSIRARDEATRRGGTVVLCTARGKTFATPEGNAKAKERIARQRLRGLLVIGGNGSLSGARTLVGTSSDGGELLVDGVPESTLASPFSVTSSAAPRRPRSIDCSAHASPTPRFARSRRARATSWRDGRAPASAGRRAARDPHVVLTPLGEVLTETEKLMRGESELARWPKTRLAGSGKDPATLMLMESRALPLFGASALATLGYTAISMHVAKGKTWDKDLKARREIVERSTTDAKKVAKTTHHIGKWYVLVPLGLATGMALAWRGRLAAGVTIAGASLAAPASSSVLDRVMKWRQPPPGKPNQSNTSYPSGHALETTAVAVTSAWVLARERVASGWIVAPVAVAAAAISGLGRLVLDRHWSTDSAAGYLAGLALGCAGAGVYELTSPKR